MSDSIFVKAPICCANQEKVLDTIPELMGNGPYLIWYEPRQGSTNDNGYFYSYKEPMFSNSDKAPKEFEKGLIISEMRIFTAKKQYHQVRTSDGLFSGVLWIFEGTSEQDDDVKDYSSLGRITVEEDMRVIHSRMRSHVRKISIRKYFLEGILITWTIIPESLKGESYV